MQQWPNVASNLFPYICVGFYDLDQAFSIKT